MAAPVAPAFWSGDAIPIYGGSEEDEIAYNSRYRGMFNSAAVASTITSGSNLPGPWRAVQYLGSGGTGQAVLYVRFDAADTIRERLVVKEVQCSASDWYDPMMWPGPADGNGDRIYSAGMNHSQSMETLIHRKLSRRRCNALLEYIGHSPVEQIHWRYRLFTQYAEHGSLDDVISYYRRAANFPGEDTIDYEDEQGLPRRVPEVWIPEAFIWYCFQNLARAAMVMECGDETLPGVAGWRSIVHRDIKPDNVLLQAPGTGPQAQWRLYPIPKLSDMDLAVETSATNPNDPKAYQGPGTPGYRAPEQLRWVNRNTRSIHDTPAMDAATNVFAIGMIIYCLVYRVLLPELDFSEGDGVPAPEFPIGLPIEGANYSSTLTDLMDECLRYNPSDRPSLSRLLNTIDNKKLDSDTMHFKGMRKIRPKANRPWFDNGDSVHHLKGMDQDRYRLSMARNNLPPPIVPFP